VDSGSERKSMLPDTCWERIRQLDPVVVVPRTISTGEPVLVDCLMDAVAGDAGGVGATGGEICITQMLTPGQAREFSLPTGLELPEEASPGLMVCPAGRWPVVRLDHQAFSQIAAVARGPDQPERPWNALLRGAAQGRIGLAMAAPGESLCPVFAPRRWLGATGGLLLAAPGDSAAVCLDIHLCACLDNADRMNWAALRHVVVEAVRVGNQVLDALPLAGGFLGERSVGLRRLSLHLCDLGMLATRQGMKPELPSTVSRLLRVVKVAADAALGESLRLGRLEGPFPALLEADWVRKIEQPAFRSRIQALLDRFWLRNSQLLSLSPDSLLAPAETPEELLAWANLIPLLASVDGFSARLPRNWRLLSHDNSARLLGRIWALGLSRHQVRAY